MVQPVDFFAATQALWHLETVGGLVYIAGGAQGPYKIGYTTNPVSRWDELRREIGKGWGILHVIWSDDPYYIEQQLHRLFWKEHIEHPQGTEWFALNVKQLKWLIDIECIDAEWMKGYIYKRKHGLVPDPGNSYRVEWA